MKIDHLFKPSILLSLLFIIRAIQSFFLATYFNPDEYWQSSEIAHNIVYGYGYVSWEWQKYAKIRGFIHPLLFACVFKILEIVGVDNQISVEYSSKLIQIVITVISDYYIYLLSKRVFNEIIGRITLVLYILSWFITYCMLRTFSNSIETMFSIIAYYYWNYPDVKDIKYGRLYALIYAALAFSFRPTSVTRWLFMGLYLIVHSNDYFYLILEVLSVGIVTLALNLIIDRAFYGEWTLVIYNFLNFNSSFGVSELYGTHPWWWYFVLGLPVMLLTYSPFFINGLYLSLKQSKKSLLLALVILVELLFYTTNVHKEYRFILPILPIAIIFAAVSIYEWGVSSGSIYINFFTPDSEKDSKISKKFLKNNSRFNFAMIFTFLVQFGLFIYLGIFHQRAPVSVVRYLSSHLTAVLSSNILQNIPTINQVYLNPQPIMISNSYKPVVDWSNVFPGISNHVLESFIFSRTETSPYSNLIDLKLSTDPKAHVSPRQLEKFSELSKSSPPLFQLSTNRPFAIHFLIGCHNTPYYATMHINYFVPMRILECAPPIHQGKIIRGERTTETLAFLKDPVSFVNRFYRDPKIKLKTFDIQKIDPNEANFDAMEWLPTHLVIFDEHANLLKDWLHENKYREINRFFHSFSSGENYIAIFTSLD